MYHSKRIYIGIQVYFIAIINKDDLTEVNNELITLKKLINDIVEV